MTFPYPYKIYKNVCCIDPCAVKEMGVKGILLDIDGTLMRTKDYAPSEEVMNWLSSLKREGIAVYVLSNNKHPDRVKRFADSIGAECTHLAHKPKKRGFLYAAERLGLKNEELAVVGDQIFTDMYGAVRCGMKGLLVESLDTYLWYYHPRHLLELIFWKEKKK